MSRGVSTIGVLLDDKDEDQKLIEATKRLCHAFTDLLNAAEPETREVGTKQIIDKTL